MFEALFPLVVIVLALIASVTGADPNPGDHRSGGAEAGNYEVTLSGKGIGDPRVSANALDSQSPNRTAVNGQGGPEPILQTPEQALAEDLALAAEAHGWSTEQAAAANTTAEIAGDVATQLADRMPETYVGGALSPQPGGVPRIYIKGPANDFVRDLIADAGIRIDVVDNQPYSFDELVDRNKRVHEALKGQGFRYISSEPTLEKGGYIAAVVTREPGLPDDPAEVLSALPEALRDTVELEMSEDPVTEFYNAFGGMWMKADGDNACTSGWPVWNASGTTGVTTAGHCEDIDEINVPGQGQYRLRSSPNIKGSGGISSGIRRRSWRLPSSTPRRTKYAM